MTELYCNQVPICIACDKKQRQAMKDSTLKKFTGSKDSTDSDSSNVARAPRNPANGNRLPSHE